MLCVRSLSLILKNSSLSYGFTFYLSLNAYILWCLWRFTLSLDKFSQHLKGMLLKRYALTYLFCAWLFSHMLKQASFPWTASWPPEGPASCQGITCHVLLWEESGLEHMSSRKILDLKFSLQAKLTLPIWWAKFRVSGVQEVGQGVGKLRPVVGLLGQPYLEGLSQPPIKSLLMWQHGKWDGEAHQLNGIHTVKDAPCHAQGFGFSPWRGEELLKLLSPIDA